MRRKLLLPLLGCITVLLLHASYSIWQARRLAERWSEVPGVDYFALYLNRAEYLIGASYTLAAGFSIYALLRFAESQKRGLAGLIGGITVTGVLYMAGCFLVGCCGSPMLAVYLALFGSSFLGFAKPLTFVLTLASVVVGYFWMERNSPSAADCCGGEEKCK